MAALEQLSLASGPQQPGSSSPPAGAGAGVSNGRQLVSLEESPRVGSEESPKVGRLPRWTRQEILVLIQGKRVAENRVRRGRSAGLALGSSGQVEPKWASVSSYCKRHGVNRGPVQCRKRWSNLAGDFKKIKEWESRIRDETDSFWLMRNDLRRERKLPGFFDKEVFDILDGGGAAPGVAEELELALAPSMAPDEDPVFDSGRSAGPDDGLFSDDFEQSDAQIPTAVQIPIPIPISEKQYQPFCESHQPPPPPPPGRRFEMGGGAGEGKKRKRQGEEEEEEEEEEEDDGASRSELIRVMEKNGKLLSSQLESHNIHLQLEREQRKDHVNNLISVLNKLADAMGRIADKL